MRGDYNNNWINSAEFDGAVNQEIELYGIYDRGIVDQQDRGYREAIISDGSRTRNPSFGGRIHRHGGHLELFGYGKASIASGLLAVIRRRLLGESIADLDETYPTAASQRDVVQVIEAAAIVADKNYEHFQAGRGTPTTAFWMTRRSGSSILPRNGLSRSRQHRHESLKFAYHTR
ncbi:MAG: hypothetical protein CMJ64_04900 [Planctomycetaceae bacterium]|nr:hypothetical protein [Planctomycetaceae bacterium]